MQAAGASGGAPVLPYLIIAGNGKCHLQVMELHRADGVEPVHYLLRGEQDRTESFPRAAEGASKLTQLHPALS